MAWDEWEQLKADALARRQNHMRLDGVGGTGASGNGGTADLKTNKLGVKAAVKALREDIRPGADKAGNHAKESSSAVVLEFADWGTGAGLKDALAEWELQVKNLQGRLGSDQTALQGNQQDFQYLDLGVRSQIAQIDAGPDPRRDG
ncbi:hypothetical protein [Streptomyces gossypiisoli]|uniref:hypothetical protein n=1 Tax=Streptomyces gossypiisoli TaxID=2748864 RepID=UPI0015DA9994|nr:hypothetical protein [Streptomyces gossypiisoli]